MTRRKQRTVFEHVWAFLFDMCQVELANPGTDPGEVKWVNFHPPPLFLSPLLSSFSYPSNTSTRLWFYYITKIHPPFQNPGSAPAISNLRSESERKYSNRTRTIAGSPLSRLPPSYSKANLGITHTESLLAGYIKI